MPTRPALQRFTQGPGQPSPKPAARVTDKDPIIPPQKELETDADYISMIEEKHQVWWQYRYAYEPGWYEAVAFYLGLQYAQWNYLDRVLQEGKAPTYRVKMVFNRMQGYAKSQMGKFFQNKPTFIGRPKNPSDTAYSDAVVITDLLDDRWRELKATQKNQMAFLWAILTGTAFMKVGWDPTLGVPIDWPEETGLGTTYPGEISMIPMGPLNILTPPSQKDLDGPSEIMEVRAYPLEWVKQTFGDAAAGLTSDEISWQSSFEYRIQSLISPTSGTGYSSRPMMDNMVYLKELWTDPQLLSEAERKKFPCGRVLTTAQKKVLMLQENPFNSCRHPYNYFQYDLMPDRFLGATAFDQLKMPQKAINRRVSQLVEEANLTAQPIIDVEKGHGIERLSTSEPGAVNQRNRGFQAPVYRKKPELSQAVAKVYEEALNNFEEIGQLHQISRGIPMTSNLSGPTVEMLQGADNEPVIPCAQRFAAFLTGQATMIVQRAQQYYTEERTITIIGPQNETDVVTFLAQAHQTELDVECMVDSVIPQSPASRQTRVSDLLKLQVLNPVTDRSEILSIYRFGNVKELFTEDDEDRQKAVRENRKMMAGQPCQVAIFDNDLIHLRVLNRFRKSPQYDSLPPEIQFLYDSHAQAHQQKLMQIQAALNPQPQTTPQGSPAAPPQGPTPIGV